MAVENCNTEFFLGFDGHMKRIRWNGVDPVATQIDSVMSVFGHIDKSVTDLKGRLYTGTLNTVQFCSAPKSYAFYRYDKGNITTLVEHIKATTGIAIDLKRNHIYHADFCAYCVVRFDHDPVTGDVCEYFICFNCLLKKFFDFVYIFF